MKRIASVFSIIGAASGVFVALAPWIPGGGGPAQILLLSGVVLMATHWLTFLRIHAGSGTRLGLLLPNAVLLAIILLGLLYLPSSPVGAAHFSPKTVLLAAFFLLPLASNVIYLSIQRRTSESHAFGS